DLDATRLPIAPSGPGMGGPGLVVRTNTGTERFAPGRAIRIGREPGLELSIDDSAVSRQHAVLEPRPDGWWFVDRSTGGSYDTDGDRITQRRISEPTTVMLGHPTAGCEIEIVPAVDARTAQRGIARKRRRKGLLVGSAAALALLLVIGGVVLGIVLGHNGGGGGSTTLSKDALERAKRASVFIIAEDSGGQPIYTGSGSIISDTGLILTAGHVGEPQAPGESVDVENPATLLIALTSPQDDKPVKAAFEAKPIVTDGVLDLSVLQITADAEGNPIASSDLADQLPTPIPLGDSDDLSTGDEITALGFPALASLETSDQLSPSLTVTKGVVATFEANSDLDTQRAWIDSDVRIGSGNSGGASINERGELIGVNDAVITATTAQGNAGEFTGGSALIRPVALAQDIIDIAKRGGDPSYTSPYLQSMPDPSQQTQGVTATSEGWSTSSSSNCSGTPSLSGVAGGDTIYAWFRVAGISDGTSVTFTVYDASGQAVDSASQPWSYGASSTCVGVPYQLKASVSSLTGVLSVAGQDLARNPVRLG
ncbi:MAG TPA: trypsin-like peptidase domain-containing protein, partial [Nocardioides sp.]|nr:trypsin-like peptidase domain-containing protein [Nocardioides sp.]